MKHKILKLTQYIYKYQDKLPLTAGKLRVNRYSETKVSYANLAVLFKMDNFYLTGSVEIDFTTNTITVSGIDYSCSNKYFGERINTDFILSDYEDEILKVLLVKSEAIAYAQIEAEEIERMIKRKKCQASLRINDLIEKDINL